MVKVIEIVNGRKATATIIFLNFNLVLFFFPNICELLKSFMEIPDDFDCFTVQTGFFKDTFAYTFLLSL